MTNLTFYWGAASGSARKVLRQLEEPNVAINYATKLNEPWDGIENLLIDSGGYSFMLGKGEYGTTDTEYLAYIERVEPAVFALRDYPCEPDVRAEHNRTVADHQAMTTDRHRALLDTYDNRGLDAEPMAVLQGWHPQDYLRHLDGLREAGCLTDRVAIGTLCGRKSNSTVREIVMGVREALPAKHDIHAFGVKLGAFKEPRIVDAVDSADSNSYDQDERKHRTRGGDGRGRDWRDVAYFYLKHKRKIRRRTRSNGHADPSDLRAAGQLGLADCGEENA